MATETKPTPPAAPADPVKAAAAAAASAAIEALLPTIAAMLAQQQRPAGAAGPRAPLDAGPRCPICGQFVRACGGPPEEGKKDTNHSKIVVYPQGGASNLQIAQWFTGVVLNGVRYLSDRPGHAIHVPKVAEADILATVERWSEEELLARVGRKVRVDKHNPVTRGDDNISYV